MQIIITVGLSISLRKPMSQARRLRFFLIIYLGAVHKVRHARGVREGVTVCDRGRGSRACDVTKAGLTTRRTRPPPRATNFWGGSKLRLGKNIFNGAPFSNLVINGFSSLRRNFKQS